jgi:hypothetical protein
MSDRIACSARTQKQPVFGVRRERPFCDRNAYTTREDHPLCRQHASMLDRWVQGQNYP